MVKDKARFYQLQRREQPEKVTVKVSELEERVRSLFVSTRTSTYCRGFQAKGHDIFDIMPFLRSKLFTANGYKLKENIIEKEFVVHRDDQGAL
jgi:DNA replication licensing factor MCM2